MVPCAPGAVSAAGRPARRHVPRRRRQRMAARALSTALVPEGGRACSFRDRASDRAIGSRTAPRASVWEICPGRQTRRRRACSISRRSACERRGDKTAHRESAIASVTRRRSRRSRDALEDGEAIPHIRVGTNKAVVRIRLQAARGLPVLEGLGVVEQEKPSAVHLLELGTTGELGSVDEHRVERLDSVAVLDLRDARAGKLVDQGDSRCLVGAIPEPSVNSKSPEPRRDVTIEPLDPPRPTAKRSTGMLEAWWQWTNSCAPHRSTRAPWRSRRDLDAMQAGRRGFRSAPGPMQPCCRPRPNFRSPGFRAHRRWRRPPR